MNADYSTAELRLMAAYANCKSMLEDFESGVDYHKLTAAKIYNKDIEDVTSEERQKAKSTSFGIIYGITAYGLAKQIKTSVEEAQKLIDSWFEIRPEVKAFIELVFSQYEKAQVGQTVKFMNIFGRLRRVTRVPKVIEVNGKKKYNSDFGHIQRECVNYYPQSTVADILHLGMVRLRKALMENDLVDHCRVLLTIHDAVLLEVREEKVEQVAEVVKQALEFPVQFPFVTLTLPVDISWSKVWRKD